jgi:hypothetical protein
MMKKWIVILLAVAAAGFGTYKKWPDWKPKASGENITGRPTTAEVETRSIKFAVSAAKWEKPKLYTLSGSRAYAYRG